MYELAEHELDAVAAGQQGVGAGLVVVAVQVGDVDVDVDVEDVLKNIQANVAANVSVLSNAIQFAGARSQA